MKKLFGTDGVRGIANRDPMTAEMALQLGRATAYICKEKTHRHRIVIGKDTRLSGYMLESALVSGICSMGVDALIIGPMPTPGIAFLTRSMRADAGMVISASHNPFQDNGIKIFSRDGFKLPDQLEETIEKLILNNTIKDLRPTADEVGKAFRIDDAIGRYIVFLKNTFPTELDLEGLKLVIDCGNGAAYKIAPAVFEELGASVTAIGISPNGKNINADCGSLYPDRLKEEVLKTGANLGIAFDGDADRVIFVDETGAEINGDQIMAICALEMARQNKLAKNTLVATVMSNMGLEKALETKGIEVVRTQVGDRYVVEEMRRQGYNFGGEQSGHLIFMDHNTTGDGILSALQLLAVLVQTGKPLSELSTVMVTYPQLLKNIPVKSKTPLEEVPVLHQRINEIELAVQGRGRLLVRYSGTENKLRVMMEGESIELITGHVDELADLVRQNLGQEEA